MPLTVTISAAAHALPLSAEPHGEYEFHLSRTTSGLIALFCGKKLKLRQQSMLVSVRELGQACIDERNGGDMSWLQARDILARERSAPTVRRVLGWLVAAGVLYESPSGKVRIHNYEKNNRSREDWRRVKDLRRVYWREAKRAQRVEIGANKRTTCSFEPSETGSAVPNSANVHVSALQPKKSSPSPASSFKPLVKASSVMASLAVLQPAPSNLDMEADLKISGVEAEAGEGDYKSENEGGVMVDFAAWGAKMQAAYDDDKRKRYEKAEEIRLARERRHAAKHTTAAKFAEQGVKTDALPAKFAAPPDDDEIADTQWLYANVCCTKELRMLNLQKTAAYNYSRGQIRAAAANLVAQLPCLPSVPLAMFIDALKKLQTGDYTDARLRDDIRLAKHGWDNRLYALAGRWPNGK